MIDLLANKVGETELESARRTPLATREPITDFSEGFNPSFDYSKTLYNIGSEQGLRGEVVRDLIDRYEEVTGKEFDSKVFGEYRVESFVNQEEIPTESEFITQNVISFLRKAIEENPELADKFNFDIEGQVTERLVEAVQGEAALQQDTAGLGTLGRYAGGFAAAAVDPIMLASSVAGGYGFGARAGFSIGKGALAEFGVGMAVEALAVPSITSQVERGGGEYSAVDAALGVVTGGVASAGLYAGFRGVGVAGSKIRDSAAGLSANDRMLLDFLEQTERETLGWFGAQRQTPIEQVNEHLYNIDRTTAAIVSDQMLPQIYVDVDRISYRILDDGADAAKAFAKTIDDPSLRKLFLSSSEEIRTAIRREVEGTQAFAANAAEGAGISLERGKLGKIDASLENINTRIKEAREVADGLETGAPSDPRTIAALVKDDATAGRLNQIADELDAKPSKAARSALEREADAIIETVREEAVSTAKRRLSDLLGRRDIASQSKGQILERLRDTDKYRREIDSALREMQESIARQHARAETTGEVKLQDILSPGSAEFYPMTPVRSRLVEHSVTARQLSEEMFKRAEEIDVTHVADLRRTSEEVPDSMVRITDPETNTFKEISFHQAIKELDEEADFIKAFKECRIG